MNLQPVGGGGQGPGPLPPEDRLPARRKRAAVPLVLAGLGLGLGLSHLYVRKTAVGAGLLAVSAVSILLLLFGQRVGLVALGLVWVVDLVGGLWGVRTYNALLDDLEAAQRHGRPPRHLLN